MEDTNLVERLVKVEQSDKSAHHRLDEQEKNIDELKKTYVIMEKMDFRMENVEKNVAGINIKLEEVDKNKGRKWDKLIDYIFYFILSTILGYIAIKLGLK
jgi:hypothetical protein